MNQLVMILKDEDGFEIENPVWCLVHVYSDSPSTLCDGQVFGFAEGSAVYKTKSRKRGGITCRNCIDFIKHIKSIKL